MRLTHHFAFPHFQISHQFSTNDVMQQKAIRAPQLRLRFGRSDPSWAMFNEHQLDEQQFADATRQPSKTLRGDEPTSIESTEVRYKRYFINVQMCTVGRANLGQWNF